MADTDAQAAFYEAGDAAITDWWNSPEGQFFTDGEPLTPDMLAEMRLFQTGTASPAEVYGAWIDDSRSVAEAEAAYAEAGLADEQALADILEQADAIFGDPGAAATAVAIEPPDGGGPDLVPGDAGTRGEAGGDIGAAVAAAADSAAAGPALAAFDDPAGPGVAAQVESLVHDLRAEIEGEPAVVAADDAASAIDIGRAEYLAAERAAQAAYEQRVADIGPPPVQGKGKAERAAYVKAKAAHDAATAAAASDRAAAKRDNIAVHLGPEPSLGTPITVEDAAGLIPDGATVAEIGEVLARVTDADQRAALVDYLKAERFANRPADVDAAAEPPTAPAAPANPLDLGEAVDPAVAERQRLELQLRADAPKRGPVAQEDMASTSLFGQVDAFLTHDGRPTTKRDLLAEIDADDEAIKRMRDCL
jgi:hypothetical protein